VAELWLRLGTRPAAGEVGAKAAALDRLITAALPVPRATVITTTAYRRFVDASGLDGLLAELDRAAPPMPAEFDAEARKVEEAFLAAPLPADIASAVAEATAATGASRVAVRSSATAEDTAGSSFAGQYRSLLDVAPEAAADAVVRVWASLWSPAARVYRSSRGIDADQLAMAVVVMAMVDPVCAGVAFSVDPQHNADVVRVEAVAGLAEELVSGRATPEVYLVPRSGRPDPSLPGAVVEAARLAQQVEELEGAPQDIEWAADREHVYLVQARPITTQASGKAPPDDDGFDAPLNLDATYTPAGVVEMLPGVLPPLVWTVNGPLVEHGFRSMLDDLGVDVTTLPGALLTRARGRAALNLDALKLAAADMPGGSPEEVERQYFGEVLTPDGSADARQPGGLRTATAGIRVAAVRRRLIADAAIVTVAIDTVIDHAPDLTRMTDDQLLGYRRRVHELAARAISIEVGAAAMAAASYRTLEQHLGRLDADDPSSLAQALTAGAVPAVASGRALDLDRLVAELSDDRHLARAVAEGSPDDLDALTGSTAGRTFAVRWSEACRRAGSVSVFGGRTWVEEPQLAWSALQAALDTTPDERPDDDALGEFERRLASTWRWRLTRVMTGQVIDLRRRLLRRLVGDASVLLALREDTKLMMLRLGGESRRTALEAGRRLGCRAVIGDPEDVELLSDAEVSAALSGTLPEIDLDRRRSARDACEEAGPLPRTFSGRPRAATERAAVGSVLDGWAASSGRHRGVARVVESIATSDLHPGDVLVAHATDPSWTPLFLTAGAIVVEEGGPLSHAAIVARELGLPAVLNVQGAVERLANEPQVTVDGDEGTVEIHDDADALAADRAQPLSA
jgi:rifampicin phosphotransferase